MHKQDWIVLICVIVSAVSLFVGTYILDNVACTNKASKMNMKGDYGIMQGCFIEHKPGEWVPLANYRVL